MKTEAPMGPRREPCVLIRRVPKLKKPAPWWLRLMRWALGL